MNDTEIISHTRPDHNEISFPDPNCRTNTTIPHNTPPMGYTTQEIFQRLNTNPNTIKIMVAISMIHPHHTVICLLRFWLMFIIENFYVKRYKLSVAFKESDVNFRLHSHKYEILFCFIHNFQLLHKIPVFFSCHFIDIIIFG